MREVFADTGYWVALLHKDDGLHPKAREVSKSLGTTRIVTSDSVITEFLNFFAERGNHLRKLSVDAAQTIVQNPNISVVQQTRENFFEGMALYGERLDKGYSHTDCISMVVMRKKGISEVLTHDRHFVQEGFRVLLRDHDE